MADGKVICRLCLQQFPKTIEIFGDDGLQMNVATIVSKHFWFELKNNDPISDKICYKCWWKIENFHDFYVTIEEAQKTLAVPQLDTYVDKFDVDVAAGSDIVKIEQEDEIDYQYSIESQDTEETDIADALADSTPIEEINWTADQLGINISSLTTEISNNSNMVPSTSANEEPFERDIMEDSIRKPHRTSMINMNAETLKNIEDLDFKIIYGEYLQTRNLSNSSRVKLAKVLIKYVFTKSQNFELRKRDFINISKTISQVFKSEIEEVFYTPAINSQRQTGKLYDAYANIRKQLCTAGLLHRRTYSNQGMPQGHATQILAGAEASMDYVKVHTGSVEEILPHWKISYSEREKILENKLISFDKYLALFPIFSTNENFIFKLFLSDVQQRYPNIRGIDAWDQYYNFVLKEAAVFRDLPIKKYTSVYTELPEHSQKAVAALVLAYFFPSTRVRDRGTKKMHKASKIEMQEKFVLHFETLKEADSYEQKLKDTQCGTEPRAVFYGSLQDIKSYVTVMDKKYYFDNPIEAIYNCFLCFLALNIPYPPESITVWTYVQIYIFGIKTKSDINNSSLKSVYQTLNRHSISDEAPPSKKTGSSGWSL